jgi:hypothetical protein
MPPPTEPEPNVHARLARRLVRSSSKVALSTSLAQDRGRPHGSLALGGTTMEGEPLLLLSDLAVHTRNLAVDPRISVLYDADDGGPEPLAGNRVSVIGKAIPEPRLSVGERFLRRYPHARRYAALGDFRMYRVAIDAAHLVAGFGAIHWLHATDLVVPDHMGLAEAEPQLLETLHGEYRPWLLPAHPDPQPEWILVGLDAEGADFRSRTGIERYAFTSPLEDLQRADSYLRGLGRP